MQILAERVNPAKGFGLGGDISSVHLTQSFCVARSKWWRRWAWERRRSTPGCSCDRTRRTSHPRGSGRCKWKRLSWCTGLEGGDETHRSEQGMRRGRERQWIHINQNKKYIYLQARSWKMPEMVNLWPLLRVKSWATNTKMPRMENIQARTELACTAWR